jgi:hypothetical protein
MQNKLLENLELVYISILVSSERRIRGRHGNAVKVTVRFIRTTIKYNRIKVERNGGKKGRNISCSLCRKWEESSTWLSSSLVLCI